MSGSAWFRYAVQLLAGVAQLCFAGGPLRDAKHEIAVWNAMLDEPRHSTDS